MYNTFDEVVETRFHNQKIKLKCIVVGKTLTPYHIPKRLTVQCANRSCRGCQFQNAEECEVEVTDNTVLMFIDKDVGQLSKIMKDILGVSCRQLIVEVLEVQFIERIFIARPTGKERTRKGGGTREAFVIGKSIETNTIYDLEGYTTTHPTTQATTHIFLNAEKAHNDVENFNLSTKKHSELNQFCVPQDWDAQKMMEKLITVYKGYASHVTKIYERDDMHLAVDMLFRSVISFTFDKEYVHKGWLDAMIIGDTRCGKGFVAERLINYFGQGEVVNGENCTSAGLIGGVQKFGSQWVITWGKIPMNDCCLLLVDETSGLPEDVFGKLSRVRSEGVAEITKIHTEVANARTRLLFLCNPTNRTINTYSYGIQSVLDIVKAPEDIARFDYVLVVSHNDVKGEEINIARQKTEPLIYDPKYEQELVLWCWSRKPDEVKFTPEAVTAIYEMSLRLAKAYDFSIPLIQVENVRYKIAKIAIAFAARFYSNEEKGRYLLVKTVHVECAWVFFDIMYKKEASGYLAYSRMRKSAMVLATPEKLQEVEQYFDTWKLQKKELLRCLLVNNYIDQNEIATHMGVDKRLGVECISKLLKLGCLQRTRTSYIKSPELTHYLKKVLLGGRK